MSCGDHLCVPPGSPPLQEQMGSMNCMAFLFYFWDFISVLFLLSLSYHKPSHLPLPTLLQTNGLFFISCYYNCVFVFVYTYVFSNVMYWVHIMLLVCMVCSAQGRSCSSVLSFTQLPAVLCIGLRPVGFSIQFAIFIGILCSSHIWALMLARLYGYSFWCH